MSGIDVMAVLDVYCQRAGIDPTADVVKVRAAVSELIERMSILVTHREFFLSGKPECSADWINAKRALARCRGGES